MQQTQLEQDLFELIPKDILEPTVQQRAHEVRMLIDNT